MSYLAENRKKNNAHTDEKIENGFYIFFKNILHFIHFSFLELKKKILNCYFLIVNDERKEGCTDNGRENLLWYDADNNVLNNLII